MNSKLKPEQDISLLPVFVLLDVLANLSMTCDKLFVFRRNALLCCAHEAVHPPPHPTPRCRPAGLAGTVDSVVTSTHGPSTQKLTLHQIALWQQSSFSPGATDSPVKSNARHSTLKLGAAAGSLRGLPCHPPWQCRCPKAWKYSTPVTGQRLSRVCSRRTPSVEPLLA